MRDHSPPDTAALVLAARGGDSDAFAMLIARYQQGVFGHLLSRCGDPGRAGELAHDAFVTAYSMLHRLEKPASFRAWVIGIGLNLMRRRKREVADLELLRGFHDGRDAGLDAMANGERIEAVRRAIAELPENYRSALLLHYFDGLRGRAIGDELGISEGAVHMLLLRARMALAEKLKEFSPECD